MSKYIGTINRILLSIFVLLFFYFYVSMGRGEDEPNKSNEKSAPIEKKESEVPKESSSDIEELRRQIKELKEEVGELKKNLPDTVKNEVGEAQRQEKIEDDARNQQWRVQSQQSKWSLEGGPPKHNLMGRMMVGPGPDYEGAYGVLFDVNSGANISSKNGADRVNFYRAKITPFIQFDTWGAQMALNVRKFLQNEVIKGELRNQISNQDFETAYVYYRPINAEQVEVVAYLGQVNEPFIREVVDQSVFTNRSILDKYRLNTSMALRVDVGFGRIEGENSRIVERPIWIQAAHFNLDQNNRDFADFAARVILSLSVLNRFADFHFEAFQMWGGFAQIKSGRPSAGELRAFTDPSQTQQMAVFGLQFDLSKLTGKDLGVIYGEFVHRRKTGDIKDKSWVIGYEIKFNIREGYRPLEVGVRYQNQSDDPDPRVSDGSIIQASMFYPLTPQNVGIRLNAGYIIKSTDPDRNGKLIFSAEIEVLW